MKTILFVEDDTSSLMEFAKEIFLQDGIDCILCSSASQALYAMRETNIDVIILDLILSKNSYGQKVLSKMIERGIDIPIIATSGIKGKSSYINLDTLENPNDLNELKEKLSKYNINV